MKNTWTYLDNLSTTGNIQKENNDKILAAAKKQNFTFNKNKSIIPIQLNYLVKLFPINTFNLARMIRIVKKHPSKNKANKQKKKHKG